METCTAGVFAGDTCDPLAGAAADDTTCDGTDDDCDGSDDEDFVTSGTTCGVGACSANTGNTSCVLGSVQDSCDPLAGAAVDDTTCDGIDDDCDGSDDENFVSSGTTCGVGACSANTGATSCVAGSVQDSCDPLAGAAADDTTCDGTDDDCDGSDDEDFVTSGTTCGVGACSANTGNTSCVLGSVQDSCDPARRRRRR